MKYQIGELVAAEGWGTEGIQVGIIVGIGGGGWYYTVYWNKGEKETHHVTQIEIFKEVLNARVV